MASPSRPPCALRAGNSRGQRAIGLFVIGLAAISLACDGSPTKTTTKTRQGQGQGQGEARCESRPVRMAVASSLREVGLALIEDLASRDDPIAVEASFGASSALARQLELGAPIDLIVSADAAVVETLGRLGSIDPGSQREIARGRLVLVAPTDSELPDQLRAALSSPDFDRIALPAAAVPLGRYARAWLEDQGLLADLDGRIITTEHARATLAAVDQGHADLALVYESDARLGRRIRVLETVDPKTHPPIRYVVALASRGSALRPPPCVEPARILGEWSSPATRERLAQAGFLVGEHDPNGAGRIAEGNEGLARGSRTAAVPPTAEIGP